MSGSKSIRQVTMDACRWFFAGRWGITTENQMQVNPCAWGVQSCTDRRPPASESSMWNMKNTPPRSVSLLQWWQGVALSFSPQPCPSHWDFSTLAWASQDTIPLIGTYIFLNVHLQSQLPACSPGHNFTQWSNGPESLRELGEPVHSQLAWVWRSVLLISQQGYHSGHKTPVRNMPDASFSCYNETVLPNPWS